MAPAWEDLRGNTTTIAGLATLTHSADELNGEAETVRGDGEQDEGGIRRNLVNRFGLIPAA